MEIIRIKRSSRSRNPTFLSNMYKMYVRPHMEYCVEVWNPVYAGDILRLEKVQNKMTRLLRQGHLLTHAERNSMFRITSHEKRRLRGDMVNIFNNYDNTALFTPRNNFRTRGNEKTLKIPTWRKDIRRHSFAYSNLNEWNKLPNHLVSSPSLNSFKAHLDLYLTEV